MRRSTSERARVLYHEGCQDGTVGGSHHCLLHLIQGLDRTRYEPIVIFYDSHALLNDFYATAETHVWSPPAPVRWSVRTRWNWLSVLLLIGRRMVNAVRFFHKVGEYWSFLNQHRIDLLHLNNTITRNHEWIWAALLAGVPCVVSERGFNERYTAVDRYLARRLRLIIPVSCCIMDQMICRGVVSDSIRVFYDGISVDGLKISRSVAELLGTYGIKPDQPIVGIVGNIREWKGQETVVRALINVTKIYPDVVCFFVGAWTEVDEEFKDRLDAIIKDAGIEANVRFTGYQRDPASFISMMQVVIHASIRPEPFGMVVLEAMAKRKPVIGAGAGGICEIVAEGETGYTFPPGDSAALSAKIVELLDCPDRAAQMGEQGYSRLVSVFSPQRFMQEIHMAYAAILCNLPVPESLGISPKRK